ncbi:MAG TPA: MBL fold metallo-hydrolase [Porticoccaceae bacterium]|nr:MBL fold metallo-hydrolase [Porticoccaceae bacterium]
MRERTAALGHQTGRGLAGKHDPQGTGTSPAPRIHQIKGRLVNSYVIEQGDELAVVDVAWRGEKYVLGHVREVLGREPEAIRLVVCTHGDPDHSGGVRGLARICGAGIGLPLATHSLRRHLARDPLGFVVKPVTALIEGMRPRAWAMYASPARGASARQLPTWQPEPDALAPPTPGRELRLRHHAELPGFSGWRVLHTPGHSWDSVCYYHAASGSLISGDTLLGSTSRGVLVPPSVYANPLQMARTLKQLKALHPRAVYPGHGGVFDGRDLLGHL